MARRYGIQMDFFELLMFALAVLVILGVMETVVVGSLLAMEVLGTASPWRLPSPGDSPGPDIALALAQAAFFVAQVFVGSVVPYLAILMVGLHSEWLFDLTTPMVLVCGPLGALALGLALFSGLTARKPDRRFAGIPASPPIQGRSTIGGQPAA
jgi:hypothetical protein